MEKLQYFVGSEENDANSKMGQPSAVASFKHQAQRFNVKSFVELPRIR